MSTSFAPVTRLHDTIVIGGGVAGLTAARQLAQWGHDVVLMERRPEPPAGAGARLGLSLPPSCTPVLDALGVRAAMDAAGFVRGTGNTVWWGGTPETPARARLEPYASGRVGYQVEQGALEALLWRLAHEAGVDLRPGLAAVRVQVEAPGADGDEGPVTRVVAAQPAQGPASDTAPITLRARWVLDATGRTGLLARDHRAPAPVRTLALAAVWERASGWPVPDATHTLVESAPWGWGWSVPTSETRRCVTVMVDPRSTRVRAELAQYRARLAELPNLGALVQDAALVETPWAVDATPQHSVLVAWPGMLLVGDAASMLDPLSSFGVKKALTSAWLAAVTVHTALLTPAHTGAALALYAEREAAYAAGGAAALREVAQHTEAAPSATFWFDRAAPLEGTGEPDGERLARALRDDPAVRAAFAALRAAPTVRLPPPAAFATATRPVVRGNVIRPEAHLCLDGIHAPVRYLRGVDLLAVLEMAAAPGAPTDAGALFDAYARQCSPVPLPDFLGALCVLLAKGPHLA